MTIKERLKERREKAGLTQGQVSEYEEISRSYISNLERGQNAPETWGLLARLARRYHTSTDYLLGLTDDARPSAIARAAVDGVSEERALYVAVNPVVQALLDTVGRLNEWRQRELVFIAQGMASAQKAEAGESMNVLFDYVEENYGVEMADRLEHVMSLLISADEASLRRVIAMLEAIDDQ